MARPAAFTSRSIEQARCPPGKKDALLFDGDVRGFGLRVTSAGSKVFLVQYGSGGAKRRLKLGEYGVLTLADARRRARAVLGDVAGGRDPVAERKAAIVARRAAEEAARAQTAEQAFTFARLVAAWRDNREGDRRPRYVAGVVASLTKHFPTWQDRAASSITRAEALDRLDAVKAEAGPTAANRALSYSRAAFGWAVKRGHLAANPMEGTAALSREVARERVLSREEMGNIWRAAEAAGAVPAGFLRLLLLTLQRRDEVAGMRWAELDSATSPTTWTIPGFRTKNHRTHTVHLSQPARDILAGVPRIEGCDFVFASGAATAVSGSSKMKNAMVAAMASNDDPPAASWRFHDFRRTGVTRLAEMGFPPHVADKLLNHITGAIQGVAAVYQRAEFLPERKAALDAWGAYVLAAAEQREPVANVVPMVRVS